LCRMTEFNCIKIYTFQTTLYNDYNYESKRSVVSSNVSHYKIVIALFSRSNKIFNFDI